MLLAETWNGLPTILLGIAIVVTGLVLRRGMAQAKQAQSRDPVGEARADLRRRARRDQASVEMLEVRLHEFARTVEARTQTRMAVLDHLILDADREIARLQSLLGKLEGQSDTGTSSTRAAPSLLSLGHAGDARGLPAAVAGEPTGRTRRDVPRQPDIQQYNSATRDDEAGRRATVSAAKGPEGTELRAGGLDPLIFQLADAGLSPEQIGRYLKQPADDVQLRLSGRGLQRFDDRADAA